MQLKRSRDKIGLTGSGEVHNLLGSLKLPRQLEFLPDLILARFRKLECLGETAPHWTQVWVEKPAKLPGPEYLSGDSG